MLDKIKPHFLKFGPQRFVIFAVLTLLILDVVNSFYLKLYWVKKDLSKLMVFRSVHMSELNPNDLSAETLREMAGFVDNTFYFFLVLIIVNNLFFYFFYLRKKLWAQSFILFYTLTAALFSASFIYDDSGLGIGWTAYNIATIGIYTYLYFGIRLLKEETILVSGKKGR